MTAPTFPTLLALQAAAPGGLSSTGFILEMVAIGAIFYLLMIRPQQKQRKVHEERQRNLRKGDSIVTTGGIVGEVVFVKETMKDGAAQKSLDDLVTIKSGDTRVVVERRSIARITNPTASASSDA